VVLVFWVLTIQDTTVSVLNPEAVIVGPVVAPGTTTKSILSQVVAPSTDGPKDSKQAAAFEGPFLNALSVIEGVSPRLSMGTVESLGSLRLDEDDGWVFRSSTLRVGSRTLLGWCLTVLVWWLPRQETHCGASALHPQLLLQSKAELVFQCWRRVCDTDGLLPAGCPR
jgi:hypothetical protein